MYSYALLGSIFIVNIDNVGSNQIHQIRVALRSKGIVLMGKNAMVRRAIVRLWARLTGYAPINRPLLLRCRQHCTLHRPNLQCHKLLPALLTNSPVPDPLANTDPDRAHTRT
jgi:hypothetical protein